MKILLLLLAVAVSISASAQRAHATKTYLLDSVTYVIWYDYDQSIATEPATIPSPGPHYDALISVYKLSSTKNTGGLVNKIPLQGTYVPGGCIEDQPVNWVLLARAQNRKAPTNIKPCCSDCWNYDKN